jgi:L-threonylcarbamoyladenylate synthase
MVCCDAGNADACALIYRAKRRPEQKSLLLVLPSKEDAHSHFQISREAEILMEKLWPGDLALRLRWIDTEAGLRYSAVGSDVALVGHSEDTMGILAKRSSVLIAATSANISGDSSADGDGPAITLDEVLNFQKDGGVEFANILDGGICPQFTHMTIVDCSDLDSTVKIVREGVVHRRAVAAALGKNVHLL